MKDYLKLMRVKHYVKNILIAVPLFFGGGLHNLSALLNSIIGILSFCFISSAVYVLNDLKDVEKDRSHPVKKNRPIASGRIGKVPALILLSVCFVLSVILSLLTGKVFGLFFVIGYFLLNLFYSFGLKNLPIIDVVVLAAGFVIRIFYGGYITDVAISGWLYLVVVSGSLYMGLGKRRNELKRQTNTREVLRYYSEAFLDKNIYVCVALVNVFYALWSMEAYNPNMKWTVPIFFIIMLRYSYDIEKDSDGDPVEVLTHDRLLMILAAFYGVIITALLYFL